MKNSNRSSKIYAHIATLGPIGYLLIPGTLASAVTLPLVFMLQNWLTNALPYTIFLILFFFTIRFIVYKALDHFPQNQDPAPIVLDEVIGCLITFYALPFSTHIIFLGFLLFRFFDITKICGIRYFEQFDNGWGVVLDDVVAGIISNIVLRLLLC